MMKRALSLLLALLLLSPLLPAHAVENGIYTADIQVSEDLLGLTDAIVMVTDAGLTLRLTASAGEGETLTPAGEAAVAPAVNADGLPVYTLPLPALDAPVTLSYQDAEGATREFTLAIPSDSLAPLGGAAPAAAADGPGAETMEDGRYAVAAFSFSGGSGKVTLSCEDVRVKAGQATARILFSSPRYGYVKVDGTQYEGEYTDKTSAFVIPVNLNADTLILGMTTAMSQPHEIEYTLRIVPGERIGE